MIQKRRAGGLCEIKTTSFPRRFHGVPMCHSAIIGVGGNVGDTIRRLERLVNFLKKERRVSLHETSFILKNPPFGYTEQPMFYNAVVHLSTALTPKSLMRLLLRIEATFGRKRTFKNAPRTLDLDLIFFDNVRLSTSLVTLPHPHWHERASVVLPLSRMSVFQ